MKKFFRKFILHKYSDQISDIGKRPLFIISEDENNAHELTMALNEHDDVQIAMEPALFLLHIGKLAYEHYLGELSMQYQKASRFKGDKLDEQLRKISFKNTLGNNYGFELNPFKKSNGKSFKKNMDDFRWGAPLNPDSNTYDGLQYLFPDMKAVYLYDKSKSSQKYAFLQEQSNCFIIEQEEWENNKTKVMQQVFAYIS